jgi:hypothetical protein
MKPKPLGRPVSRSRMILALKTVPHAEKILAKSSFEVL